VETDPAEQREQGGHLVRSAIAGDTGHRRRNRYGRQQFHGKPCAAEPRGPLNNASLLLGDETALGSTPRGQACHDFRRNAQRDRKCSSGSRSANSQKKPAHVSLLTKVNASCAGEGELLARPVPPLELPIRPLKSDGSRRGAAAALCWLLADRRPTCQTAHHCQFRQNT
jgi:hypothetical protein